MGGRGGVTFLAAAVLVDVELGAERPQRPLLLESALENEKRERIECLLRLREGKKENIRREFKFKFDCRNVSQLGGGTRISKLPRSLSSY